MAPVLNVRNRLLNIIALIASRGFGGWDLTLIVQLRLRIMNRLILAGQRTFRMPALPITSPAFACIRTRQRGASSAFHVKVS